MTEWELPGYDVRELIGFGSCGELWRARERSSGADVVLRRVTGGDGQAVAQVRAAAAVVRSLPSTHLVRLRSTTRSGADDVLVFDHAAGGSLESLLTRRGQVESGEVVTVIAPVAEALGQAHASGLVHGRVRVSSILLTADGRPLLDGLATAALHDVEIPLPASDVWALGAIAHRLLTGQAPGDEKLSQLAPTAPLPLVLAIEAALGSDPATRPSAAALAVSLLGACRAVPVAGLPTPVVAEVPTSAERRRHWPRRAVAGVAVLVLVVLVAAGGRAWGGRELAGAAQVPAVPAEAVAADWTTVLNQLDRVRSEAFATADQTLLTRVYLAGSPALRRDQATVAGLAGQRRTGVGVTHQIRSVLPVTVAPGRVALRVQQRLAAHSVVGATTHRRPAGAIMTYLVVLRQTPAGWRVEQLAPTSPTEGRETTPGTPLPDGG